MKRYVIYGALAVFLVATFISIVIQMKGGKKEKGYLEFRVRKGKVSEIINATGEIRPATGAQISLGARVTGTVVKEPISVGDRVKKGDLIAIIDNRELRQDVKRAVAELERIKVRYENLIKEKEQEIKGLEKELMNARLEEKRAESEFRFRKWNFDSMEALFKSRNHSVSERAFREARNDFVRARHGWKEALNSIQAAQAALSKAKTGLKRLKGEYIQERKKAEAELKKAMITLSYSELRAPFSGVITYVSTQEGETVVAGLNAPQFVKILDESRVENWIYVDETDIGRIKDGMEVTFTVDAYPDVSFKGSIDKIYPAPVIQNNVVYYIAVVRIFKDAQRLHLKMTTHNQIHARTLRDVLVVPNGAVKFLDGHYVVRVKGAKGKGFVKVETGISDSRFTQIRSGLKEGDVVLYRP